jgi:hypothetical protein
MSVILCNDWVVTTDKTVIYYDTTADPVFKTGKKNEEGKFEHVISFAKDKPIVATQITGYQFWFKTPKVHYVILLPIGRGLKKDKKNVQLKDDVEIMLGLKEGKLSTEVDPEPEPVAESSTEPVAETVAEVTEQSEPAESTQTR